MYLLVWGRPSFTASVQFPGVLQNDSGLPGNLASYRLEIAIVRFVCSFEAYIRLKLIFVGMIKCVWYFRGSDVSSLCDMLAVLWGFV